MHCRIVLEIYIIFMLSFMLSGAFERDLNEDDGSIRMVHLEDDAVS
jgi:hypothetical protein